MENTKDKCKKWNQVDVYFNAMEMFKEDKNTIDMLLQKYLSGEFQEYVKLPVPLILLESKLNISTEEAMEDIIKIPICGSKPFHLYTKHKRYG